MGKPDVTLLGKAVLPLVKRKQYSASNWDTDGILPYLTGERRIKEAKRIVDKAVRTARLEAKEQDWQVWAVYADGTYCLMSDMGYEQDNVSRSDFRLLKTFKKA